MQLIEEIGEIIDYAKGNFFPTSNLLKHALVIAKKIDDKEFEEFITNELKGYRGGPLPAHRRLRGRVVLLPPYGHFQQVSIDHLDADAARKVSTAYVAERIHVIENTLNFQGDEGFFTVGFSPENEGILPPLQNEQAEYGILLVNMQLRELLDEVRTIILDWAIKRQREIIKSSENIVTSLETQVGSKGKSSPIQYVRDNKQWIFSGIGVAILLGAVTVVKDYLSKVNTTNEVKSTPMQAVTPMPISSITPTPTVSPSPMLSPTPHNTQSR